MAAGIQIGSTFAGYTIEGVLGRGGMGVVYLAEQPELGRKVAIKVIAPALASDPDYLKRFKHESRLAAAIEHPNAIPIYEAGVADEEMPYLVMRYVDGVDLATLIRREGRLDGLRAARIVEQVAGALDEAHARGLVHRDVKPGNVIVEERRGSEQAYLTDFGLTKQMDATSGVTATGRWVGTIDYASPEQIRGKHVDARSDVYALGCVLFVALTGQLPFEREADVAKLYAHINDPAPAPSSVAADASPQLDAVVSRALEKDPAQRYPSAGDLGRAALAVLTGSTIGEPERTVATGEAAPATEAADTAPSPPPGIPQTVKAEPAAADSAAASTEATAGTPPPTEALEPAPTVPTPPPAAPRQRAAGGGRRGWAPWVAGVAVVAVLAALGVTQLGGGEGDGGAGGGGGGKGGGQGGGSGGGGSTASGLEFVPFTQAKSFTVNVPANWEAVIVERQLPTAVKTELVSPDDDGVATIAQQEERPLDEVVSKALSERQADADAGGFTFTTLGEAPQTVNGKDTILFGYRWKEPGIGPATAFNYAFNAGGSGWRTRAAVKGQGKASAEQAKEIATEMATTFQPG
jgi:hypothetical protein